ncbi:hypothetical protein TARUN_7088 [Trichoderma arundinaceum]|uniref:Uncharacterized protein n=1 Tax=Trichoderma arundinaceum TaxID=490622 RepID=A0A395NGS0_TRIAR|nr:hypothetical protein TARUN_7088 [Trichoderma arundinaceum]
MRLDAIRVVRCVGQWQMQPLQALCADACADLHRLVRLGVGHSSARARESRGRPPVIGRCRRDPRQAKLSSQQPFRPSQRQSSAISRPVPAHALASAGKSPGTPRPARLLHPGDPPKGLACTEYEALVPLLVPVLRAWSKSLWPERELHVRLGRTRGAGRHEANETKRITVAALVLGYFILPFLSAPALGPPLALHPSDTDGCCDEVSIDDDDKGNGSYSGPSRCRQQQEERIRFSPPSSLGVRQTDPTTPGNTIRSSLGKSALPADIATMTNRRPSLLQARGGHHAHAHSAYKLQHGHGHAHGHAQHLHQYPHDAVSGPRPGDDKPINDQGPHLQNRAVAPVIDQKPTDEITPSPTSLITEVIQTVSVVQIVDTLGSPLETLTRFAVPNTIIVNKNTGKTISASHPDHTPAPAAPGSGPEPSGAIRSSTSSTGSQTKSASIPAIAASSPPSLLPSAHPSPPPAAHSLGIGHNGTNKSVNATSSSTKFSSTTLPITSSTSSDLSSSQATSFSEVIASTISSFQPLATDGAFGGVYGDGTPSGGDGTQPTSSGSSNSTENALSPQQKQVIGGVVGGVAGAAFFLVLVLLALRYKRRQGNAALPAGQPASESRGLPPTAGAPSGAPSGGDGSGSGGAMTERYGTAALTAAFTGSTAKRSSASVKSAEAGERGFYRVSGRKLPSVLQVGGDGYSDPRTSVMSGTSDYYRGSQAFDPFGGAGTRLQLGAPMRPDSGVPVVRSGPARAVVAEPNPFADPTTPPADAPIPAMMRLRESPPRRGSRFQERI